MATPAPEAHKPLTLPCGLTLPNRIVKAAMAEQLGDKFAPGTKMRTAYEHWARGDWGAMLTGNVMVDAGHCGSPWDVAVTGDDANIVAGWRQWADVAQRHGAPSFPQINHPGRQSPRISGNRGLLSPALAPSAVPLNLGDNLLARVVRAVVFGTPREMTHSDIDRVVAQFAHAAHLAAEAGFKGVEIHAAHGYLLSQFLSPASNRRTDEFGGTPARRAEVVLRVVRAMRERVPAGFAIGIKVNSADFQSETGLDETLEQLQLIAAEAVDFIELSGGSYENPQMMGAEHSVPAAGDKAPSQSTLQREGFFLKSAAAIRERLPQTVLMVTGGLRSRGGIESALKSGACDLVGLGRPCATYPDLPRSIVFNDSVADDEARFDVARAEVPGWLATRVSAISGGAQTELFTKQIGELAKKTVPMTAAA